MEVALEVQFNKENIGNGRWYGNRGRGTSHDYGGKDFQNPNNVASQKGEGRKKHGGSNNNYKGGGNYNGRGGKIEFDKNNV